MSTPTSTPTGLLDQPSGLLPKDPPAHAARWTGWLLLALCVAATGFAVIFRFPEVVVAPFVLVPEEGTDPIQAPLAAEIAAVRVQEGQTVKAGEELFQLRSDELRNAQARVRQLAEDERALVERARRLDEAHVGDLAIKDAEIAQADRELIFRDQHLATANDLLNRTQTLADEQLISEVELLSHRLAAAESEMNRVLTEKLLQQLALQRQERVTARARQRNDERADAEKLRVQLAALREQLTDSVGDLRFVRAPYDAVVLRVLQQTPGGMVATGAELCQLARLDGHPRARLSLPEAGVPRLRAGLPIRLFFAAFPYQRHGAMPAQLTWISPAPVTEEGGRRFVGVADLLPGNRGSLAVRVGMVGEARMLIGRRTVLERALEPLRGIRERAIAE